MIRKVAGGGKVKAKAFTLKPTVAPAVLALKLPDAPKKADMDFFRYVTMVYGRQGVGKTTFGASFPDAILFSCERVSRGVVAHDFNAEAGGVRDWDIFRQGVALLEKSPGRFATVVVDTAAAAYQHCLAWVCKQRGIEHPHDQNDFGKTWGAVEQEFAGTLDRLWASGRGVVFTAHAAEVELTSASGATFTRIQPSLSGQAFKYLKAKTDMIFYAEFVRGLDNEPLRILITEGDEVVEAKHGGNLPRYIALPKEGGAALVARAFAGEDVGLKPGSFKTGKETSEQGTRLIQKEASAAAVAMLKAAGKNAHTGRVACGARQFGKKA